jgi:hypothetical protein
MTTTDRQFSLGLIAGSFPLAHSSKNDNSSYIGVLVDSAQWNQTRSFHINPSSLRMLPEDCDRRLPWSQPCFSIHDHQGRFHMRVSPHQIQYNLSLDFQAMNGVHGQTTMETLKMEMTVGEPRIPWDPKDHGPEGRWIYALGNLIPLHWYVYSLASPATLKMQFGELTATTPGWAHVEKNWGRGFPAYWLWAQVHSADVQLVVAGGDLGFPEGHLKKMAPDSILLMFKSKQTELSWSPLDSLMHPLRIVELDAKRGILRLSVMKQQQRIEVKFEAAVSSFAPVQCPTEDGFRSYSVESFQAKATVHVYKGTDSFAIETHELNAAALEFGGQWMN